MGSQGQTRMSVTAWVVAGSVVSGAVASAAWVSPAAAATFANPAAISIPDSGAASPYPSVISVSGLFGPVTEVEVTLDGFSHTYPDDIGALLVGPGGQVVELMDGAGFDILAVDLTLTFDDDASLPLPTSGALSSGTWRPSNQYGTPYPAPAPGGPYPLVLSTFDGTDPNGNWQLFVNDFNLLDTGSISRGWSLSIETDTSAVVPLPAGAFLLLGALGLLALRRRA